MNFEKGQPHRQQGIPDGNAGMGKGSGVDDQGAETGFGSSLYTLDDLTLVVGLERLDLDSPLTS